MATIEVNQYADWTTEDLIALELLTTKYTTKPADSVPNT
jgi:hypothetical protein